MGPASTSPPRFVRVSLHVGGSHSTCMNESDPHPPAIAARAGLYVPIRMPCTWRVLYKVQYSTEHWLQAPEIWERFYVRTLFIPIPQSFVVYALNAVNPTLYNDCTSVTRSASNPKMSHCTVSTNVWLGIARNTLARCIVRRSIDRVADTPIWRWPNRHNVRPTVVAH